MVGQEVESKPYWVTVDVTSLAQELRARNKVHANNNRTNEQVRLDNLHGLAYVEDMIRTYPSLADDMQEVVEKFNSLPMPE